MPKRRTQEEFEEIVLQQLGSSYKVLGKYVNKNTKIEMIHYSCGNTFMKNPHDVVAKSSGCPYCNGNKHALYNEQWVIDNVPEKYEYISGYTKMSEKCLFKCKECKTEFLQFPSRLINEKIFGCNCSQTKKKTHEDFLKELGEDCLSEYEILEEYINTDTAIQFKHIDCGTIFKITPYRFIYRHNKKYCPLCYYKKSTGELLITQYLNKNKIDFQKEFIFPRLPLKRFDFYLPSYNLCIEYDGEQHFHPVPFFGGEEEYKERQESDSIKNQFCLDNNIPLIRIPYYEQDSIEKILHEILKNESSTTIEKYLVTEQSRVQANGTRNG